MTWRRNSNGKSVKPDMDRALVLRRQIGRLRAKIAKTRDIAAWKIQGLESEIKSLDWEASCLENKFFDCYPELRIIKPK